MAEEAKFWQNIEREEQVWNITGWVIFNPDNGDVIATSDEPREGVEKVARLDMP